MKIEIKMNQNKNAELKIETSLRHSDVYMRQ